MNKLPYDIVGERFGRLTVIDRTVNSPDGKAQFKCQCDCGNIVTVRARNLRCGLTRSCGCLFQINHFKTHEQSKNPLYGVWQGMKQRCYNSRKNSFKNYGGRGITVYEEWRDDFQAFYDYVSKLEHFGEPGRTLDRINNDGNYEPGNVRWATRKEQNNNKRNNRKET